MTPKQIEALTEIRQVLKRAYLDYGRTRQGHKGDDGHIEVGYPSFFSDACGDYASIEATRIEISAYALGPGRRHRFERGDPDPRSSTVYAADPFEAALAAVKSWLAEQLALEPDASDWGEA